MLAAGASLMGRPSAGWSLVEHFARASSERSASLDPAFLAWFNLTKCILASISLIDGRR